MAQRGRVSGIHTAIAPASTARVAGICYDAKVWKSILDLSALVRGTSWGACVHVVRRLRDTVI